MIELPSTTERVAIQTDPEINEKIALRTKRNVAYYASGGQASIDRRLVELNHEWDVERILEANAAAFSLVGLTLGTLVNRRWYILPAVVAGFLLQHAVQGWCPPVPVFRRMEVRTMNEIQQERHALKALRGDYQNISPVSEDPNRKMDLQGYDAYEAAEID